MSTCYLSGGKTNFMHHLGRNILKPIFVAIYKEGTNLMWFYLKENNDMFCKFCQTVDISW